MRALREGDSALKARVLAALSRAHIFSGLLDQAETIGQQAVEMARRIGEPSTLAATLRARLSVRWRPENLEARLAAATETIRLAETVGDKPLALEASSWRLFDMTELGDLFADIPRDGMWVTCITYLAEVCAFLGDARRATILYQALLPYAQRNILVGTTVACFGAACRYLGLLTTTMCHWEKAQQHFDDALEMNARMGQSPG